MWCAVVGLAPDTGERQHGRSREESHSHRKGSMYKSTHLAAHNLIGSYRHDMRRPPRTCRPWPACRSTRGSARSRLEGWSPPYTLNPSPYALRPTPCTLNPSPYTLHPTPYALQPKLYTPHPTPYALQPKPYIPQPTPYALRPTPYTRHPTPDILHPTPHTLNSALLSLTKY